MKPIFLTSTSLLALSFTVAPAVATAVTFNYTGSVQTYTTTKAGLYEIDVAGAQGGSITNRLGGPGIWHSGGWGGTIKGDIYLPAGLTFGIMVGGQGGLGHFGGGGGGGSFLAFGGMGAVLVAGGGGGAGSLRNGGSMAGYGMYSFGGSGTPGKLGPGAGGGQFGGGGYVSSQYGSGGAGGGFLGNGGGFYGGGGHSYENGGMGGQSWAGASEGFGGFGGGGGAGYYAGGGGGGFNGGGSGGLEGGGGGAGSDYAMRSWNWLWTDHHMGANTGDGFIIIKDGVDAPEPASLALLGGGLAGLGALRRRRKRARQS